MGHDHLNFTVNVIVVNFELCNGHGMSLSEFNISNCNTAFWHRSAYIRSLCLRGAINATQS